MGHCQEMEIEEIEEVTEEGSIEAETSEEEKAEGYSSIQISIERGVVMIKEKVEVEEIEEVIREQVVLIQKINTEAEGETSEEGHSIEELVEEALEVVISEEAIMKDH